MGFGAKKKGTTDKTDKNIETVLLKRAKNGELPCAVAHEAAKALETTPAVIGEYADRLRLRLVKCQMGLYGYSPDKKIVTPAESVSPELANAIRAGLENGRLSCKTAWEIAKRFNLKKMQVSAACDTLGIKIKPCQLGAF
jgi:hypothetical protein